MKDIFSFFAERTINHWKNLSMDVVGSPSLEVFNILVDRVLDNLDNHLGTLFHERFDQVII